MMKAGTYAFNPVFPLALPVEGQIAVIMPSLWAVFHEEEIGWSGVL
jgi:hypothetical protein